MRTFVVFLILIAIIGCSSYKDVIIALGTNSLADVNIEGDKDLKATWQVQEFWWEKDGAFHLNSQFEYNSENPAQLHYLGSVAFLHVQSLYKQDTPMGDWTVYSHTGVIPVPCREQKINRCSFDYHNELKLPQLQRQEDNNSRLDVLKVGFSWVRVFEDSTGIRYYQWIRGKV
jgi:hypothetical protein